MVSASLEVGVKTLLAILKIFFYISILFINLKINKKMKYLYFTLILLLSVTFTKAQSGLELLEGKYQSQEGDGFKTIVTAMNAERILIAAECIGA